MATTTNYSWTTPDNTAYVKDGASAIRTLGTSVDTTLYTALGGAYPGLRLIKKQVVGSGVSSVNVTSAFSATYDNYRIFYTGGVMSANNAISLKLGASTTQYYGILNYAAFASPAANVAANNNTASWTFVGGGNTSSCSLDCDLLAPFKTQFTDLRHATYSNTTEVGTFNGIHGVSASYTDFTLTPNSGTFTGGTIYVYGYGIS